MEAESQSPAVKIEATEPEVPPPVARSPPPYTNKSGASLGLMVSTFSPPFLFGNPLSNSISWGPTPFWGPISVYRATRQFQIC